MVVASGTSTRLVSSISQKLVDTLKTDHRRISKVEGKDAGDWVLIDTGDIIVHVFRPEVREFYLIEKMWHRWTKSKGQALDGNYDMCCRPPQAKARGVVGI